MLTQVFKETVRGLGGYALPSDGLGDQIIGIYLLNRIVIMLPYDMHGEIEKDAYAIIIGAMKCGTTSLYSYLQSHPEICPAIGKEPEFFSENQRFGVQVDSYNDLWDFNRSVHKYALEASTGYTKFPAEPKVPQNIFDYGIKPKFIYIIRNPFDRILSHYNFVKNKTFIKTRAQPLKMDDAHLISLSNYFLQLERYRQYFPIEDILLLDFELLEDAPLLVLQKVYRFLGLSHNYFPEKLDNHNPTRLESKFEKGLRKSKLSALFGYTPQPLKRLATNLLGKLPADKGTLTDLEKQLVHEKLKSDMANLYHVYGFDVRKWGFAV